jgi:hypothetical protein
MISEQLLRAMVARIHSFPELEGCVIGFQGNNQSRVLHPGYSATPNSARVIVVIEEAMFNDVAIIEEMNRWANSPAGSPADLPSPSVVTNRSRLGPELIGAGLSCGLTVVSAIGVIGGAAAEVPTAGASTFLIVASWVGLTTGGIQCVNGLVRVGAIVANPDGATLTEWDNNKAYTRTIFVVDAIGVASGVASLPFAARNLFAVLSRQRSFVARGLSMEALRGMNRAERLRVIGELMEEAGKTPEGRRALIEAAREADIGVSTIQAASGLSVRHANTMVRIISEETTRRLSSSLRDVIGGMAGIAGSGTPGAYTGSASGSVNWIINLIDGQAPPL